MEHHQAHAASAFFASPFEEATVLTLDHSGDFRCGARWHASQNQIQMEKEWYFPDSLGRLYGSVTELLGFRAGADEHKVQWLSASGDERFIAAVSRDPFARRTSRFRVLRCQPPIRRRIQRAPVRAVGDRERRRSSRRDRRRRGARRAGGRPRDSPGAGRRRRESVPGGRFVFQRAAGGVFGIERALEERVRASRGGKRRHRAGRGFSRLAPVAPAHAPHQRRVAAARGPATAPRRSSRCSRTASSASSTCAPPMSCWRGPWACWASTRSWPGCRDAWNSGRARWATAAFWPRRSILIRPKI